MSEDKDKVYIDCSCHTHLLVIEKDPDEKISMWYLSQWCRGHNGHGSMSWKERFRHAWRFLRHGRPFNDELVFEKSQMEKLQKYLDEQLNNGWKS
jgi:hypothetical protein